MEGIPCEGSLTSVGCMTSGKRFFHIHYILSVAPSVISVMLLKAWLMLKGCFTFIIFMRYFSTVSALMPAEMWLLAKGISTFFTFIFSHLCEFSLVSWGVTSGKVFFHIQWVFPLEILDICWDISSNKRPSHIRYFHKVFPCVNILVYIQCTMICDFQ